MKLAPEMNAVRAEADEVVVAVVVVAVVVVAVVVVAAVVTAVVVVGTNNPVLSKN